MYRVPLACAALLSGCVALSPTATAPASSGGGSSTSTTSTTGTSSGTSTSSTRPDDPGPEGCDGFGFSCPSIDVWIDVAEQIVPLDAVVDARFVVAGEVVENVDCDFDDHDIVVEGVAGTVEVAADGHGVRFTPDVPLAPASVYDVVASATLECYPTGGNLCSWYCPKEAFAEFSTVAAR